MREVSVRQNTSPIQVKVLHEWAVASIHVLVHDHVVRDCVRANVHIHVVGAEAFSHFLPMVVDIHILDAEVACKVVQKAEVAVANVAALAFDFQEAVEDEEVLVQPWYVHDVHRTHRCQSSPEVLSALETLIPDHHHENHNVDLIRIFLDQR